MSDKNNELKIKDTLDDLLENSTSFKKDSNSKDNISEKSPKKLIFLVTQELVNLQVYIHIYIIIVNVLETKIIKIVH